MECNSCCCSCKWKKKMVIRKALGWFKHKTLILGKQSGTIACLLHQFVAFLFHNQIPPLSPPCRPPPLPLLQRSYIRPKCPNNGFNIKLKN